MNYLPLAFLVVLAVFYIGVAEAGDSNVHVHEHVSGNDDVGDKVDGYVPHEEPVLPYEVGADQKRYEDDPDGGAEEDDMEA